MVNGGRARSSAESFEKLYMESYSSVYNYAYYRTLDATAAEDITAEAFLRAARFFDSFDSERAKFSTWVKSIANNCIADYYRKHRPTTEIDEVMENTVLTAEDTTEQILDADLVKQLLTLLDDEERQLVYMKYYEGMRNSEIAQELGMNQSTISTKLSRAMAKMRNAAEGSL